MKKKWKVMHVVSVYTVGAFFALYFSSYADSLTALRCLGYFLSSKQKRKDSLAKFVDVPRLLMEPPVC